MMGRETAMLQGMKSTCLKVSTYGGYVMDCIFQDEKGFSCGGRILRHTSTYGPNSILIEDPEINWPTLKMYAYPNSLNIYHWDKRYLSHVTFQNISNWAGRSGADITIKWLSGCTLGIVRVGETKTFKGAAI